MKKGAADAKNQGVKSGNLKKPTSLASSILPTAQTGGPGQEEADLPAIIIFPEWNDAEINAEKWSAKNTFEDHDPLLLPRSLRGFFDSYKRHVDLMQLAGDTSAGVGVASPGMVDDAFAAVGQPSNLMGFGGSFIGPLNPAHATSNAHTRKHSTVSAVEGGMEGDAAAERDGSVDFGSGGNSVELDLSNPVPPDILVSGIDPSTGQQQALSSIANFEEEAPSTPPAAQSSEQDAMSQTSKFFQHNRHIITASDLMRQIIATFHFLYDQSKVFRSQNMPTDEKEFTPWDNLYPKGKDGLPMYNPTGRYAVKLFWLGCWRKVIVDDRIPVDDQNRPLVPGSPITQEIWPYLISKALVKIAAASYRDLSALSASSFVRTASVTSTTHFTNATNTHGSQRVFEHGDFDAFHALRGWVPERIGVNEREARVTGVWNAMAELNLKNAQSFAGAVPRNLVWGAPAPPPEKSAGLSTQPAAVAKNAGPAASALLAPQVAFMVGGVEKVTGAYTIVIAYRNGDDCLDLSTMGYPFRVTEVRDFVDGISNPQQQIVLRSLFALPRPKKAPNGTKNSEEVPMDEGIEIVVSLADFGKAFRCITIYHNPGSFKSLRSVQNILDPTKPADLTRIPPVLYLQDPTKEATILVSLSTFGRSKSDGQASTSSLIIEPYSWKYDPQPGPLAIKPVLRLSTNASLATFFKMPVGNQAYRFIVDCPTSYNLTFWSRDDYCMEDEAKYVTERLGLAVRDVDESFPAQQAGSWFMLFKNQVRFSDPLYLSVSLYVPDSMQSTTCLRMFNNDTGAELPHIFHNLKSSKFLPNNTGYSLLADCRTSTAKPSGKWKLRFITEPGPLFPVERPIPDMSLKPITQDFEEIYLQN
ncbi:hypothetical protein HDU80_001467, partial [Chytriomyces hyalinus]